MAPIIPEGSILFVVNWFRFFSYKVGQRVLINHPKYGLIVKKVAIVDKNGLIWSKGENKSSLPVEKIGPVSERQILGRVIKIVQPEV